LRLLLYVLLNVLWVPIYLIGLICYMVPILLARGRVSGTAYEPFNGRLLYHLMGTRPDAAALQLAPGLPAANRGTLDLLVRPMAWTSKVTGHVPGAFRYPPPRPTSEGAMVGARCEFLDKALRDHVGTGDQVVILGAGWDTRAYGLLAGRGVSIFEVDAPATQAVKRAALAKTSLDASHVIFVTCDFNRQSWLDALEAHGFDPHRRTFVLWEGVTMYLEEQAIQSTLRAVATLPPGSRIAFDFFTREWIDGVAGRMGQWALVATYGESLAFGFSVLPDFEGRLGAYMAEHGLVLENCRPMGDEREGRVPYGGLAVGVTPEA
jgi:methyltransferase (TIGR00027 family)